MIIVCPNCDTNFRVPEGVIGENGRFMRCSQCEHEWLVQSADLMPSLENKIMKPGEPILGQKGLVTEPKAEPIKPNAFKIASSPSFYYKVLLPVIAFLSILLLLILIAIYCQSEIISQMPFTKELYNIITPGLMPNSLSMKVFLQTN